MASRTHLWPVGRQKIKKLSGRDIFTTVWFGSIAPSMIFSQEHNAAIPGSLKRLIPVEST